MKKAPFMLSMYIGDTLLDVHGVPEQVDEIYIHDTDIDVTEMMHSLNWDKFEEKFKDALYA